VPGGRVAAGGVQELFKPTGGTGADGGVGWAPPALAGMLIGPFGPII